MLRRENGIIIACDSISYDETGIVKSTKAVKLLAVPELNCAIGNVGVGNFTPVLRAQMAHKYESFDQVISGAAEDFRAVLTGMILMGQAQSDAKCTAIYAGWSDERGRFETYRISARDKVSKLNGVETILPAFVPTHVPGDWCSSEYNSEDAARFGLDLETLPVVNNAVAYVCACRAASEASGSGDFEGLPYAVGGHVQVMQIERGIITTWIAHQWPDKVGEALDPTVGMAMPDWLIPGPPDEIADLERKIREALPTLKVRHDSKPGAEVHNMILADARALMAGEAVDISNSRLEALRIVASGLETMQRLQTHESAPKEG